VSVEYHVSCNPDDAWLDALFEATSHDARFVVLARAPRRLSLRFSKCPPRDRRPEDVAVQLDETGVYVAFHTAERAERAEVLRMLGEAMAGSGCAATFEEL
jgi:hypothetical protein